MEITEFLVSARLDRENLEAWIEAGWLIPTIKGKTGGGSVPCQTQ
jgi:hypothetical protein